MIDKTRLVEQLLHIDNKQGVVVPFRFNKLQEYFHRNKSNRNIILKHRQGGCCLDPSTLVLTADLRWITLRDISVGQEVVSIDEFRKGQGHRRLLRKGVVLGKVITEPEAFMIKTDRGNIIASGNHKFLSRLPNSSYIRWRSIYGSERGYVKGRLKEGQRIRMITFPWGEPSYEDGWFGGILDGEGCLKRGIKSSLCLSVTQSPGEVLERCKQYLEHYGYYKDEPDGSGFGFGGRTAHQLQVFNLTDVFEIIGKCRPSRFVDRTDWWDGKGIPNSSWKDNKKRGNLWGEIFSIVPLGKRELIDIQTSIGTFVAEGFVSHNSSSILADMFTDCITIPHTQCAVVSHETRSTQRLLDRVQFYYDTMGEPRPELGAESRSEKTFPSLHSSIYIGTAGARAFGRGDTIRKALLSELSHYEDGEKILNGVEDAVPFTGELTIECTPNGEDNVFYEKWIRAREGKSPYKPFFFPWWWSEDYSIPRGSELVLPVDRGKLIYTAEELELVDRVHLTENQIRWRRWKLGEKEGLFWQEYPEDEVSCFITIGNPVFDITILNELAQSCYSGERHPQGWQFWKAPMDKMHYIIGADSSAGSPQGSYSAAVVLNNLWEVCATFQARLEPHMFANILKQMGIWYNKAEIAVERNFTGYAVLEQLRDYSNIFHQRDFTTGKVTTQKGWWTNDSTRDLMMTIAKERLLQLRFWDVNLVRQLRSYRYIKLKSKYRESAQTYDDLAIALMIAMVVRKIAGTARGYVGKVPGWSW